MSSKEKRKLPYSIFYYSPLQTTSCRCRWKLARVFADFLLLSQLKRASAVKPLNQSKPTLNYCLIAALGGKEVELSYL